MHYDYPECALVEMLVDLIAWTHWDDQWDGNPLTSSASIVQANRRSAKTIFFTCTMFGKFNRDRIPVPFSLLATLANVALELPEQAQVDEDSVRKQVRRFQAKQAKRVNERLDSDDAPF
jgi:hypothetical protein